MVSRAARGAYWKNDIYSLAQDCSNANALVLLQCCIDIHTLSWKRYHLDSIFVSRFTRSFPNFRCNQWLNLHQNDDIRFSEHTWNLLCIYLFIRISFTLCVLCITSIYGKWPYHVDKFWRWQTVAAGNTTQLLTTAPSDCVVLPAATICHRQNYFFRISTHFNILRKLRVIMMPRLSSLVAP